MWPQPPCRNIDVIGVSHVDRLPVDDAGERPATSGTHCPTGARCVSSPGTIPKLQTLCASALRVDPAALHDEPDANMAPRMSQVMIGVRRVGFSSLSGIMS